MQDYKIEEEKTISESKMIKRESNSLSELPRQLRAAHNDMDEELECFTLESDQYKEEKKETSKREDIEKPITSTLDEKIAKMIKNADKILAQRRATF